VAPAVGHTLPLVWTLDAPPPLVLCAHPPPLPLAPAPCRLQGHENITYLQGAYEDKQAVHLVMDLCSGGELFDRWAAADGGQSGDCCKKQLLWEPLLWMPLPSTWCVTLPLCLSPAARPPVCSIVAKGSYSEKDAAKLIRDMVRVVAHCHSMGVIHRWGRPARARRRVVAQAAKWEAVGCCAASGHSCGRSCWLLLSGRRPLCPQFC